MVSPGNRHCANCIGALSFPMAPTTGRMSVRVRSRTTALVVGQLSLASLRGRLIEYQLRLG